MPGTILAAGDECHGWPHPSARIGDAAFEADAATDDDRDPLAQPLGMGDDVGGEEHGHAGGDLRTDQCLKPALIERVEA